MLFLCFGFRVEVHPVNIQPEPDNDKMVGLIELAGIGEEIIQIIAG